MNLKDKYFSVLDNGFIALKDVMGSDEDIEQAARVSYGKGTRKRNETRGLIRYLLRHKHTSPLEMVEFKFHVRVPMDTWRQWIRHRTSSTNEYSTRYSEAISLKQKTKADEWRLQSTTNKQGSGDNLAIDDGGAYCGIVLSEEETYLHKLSNEVYQHRLEAGVTREQARKDLPLSTYTEAYWKIDLHNLLHFCNLRCDKHAQQEIRQYANIIAGIVKECCPITFEAWEDYVFNATTFSYQERVLLKDCINYLAKYHMWPPKNYIENMSENMSKREIGEFINKLDYNNFKLTNFSFSGE